jgi:serine/threonine protein kinase/tetratricopeptide (TPR) repeat protein
MPQSAPTAKAVFDRAHEIASPTERQAYLDQACSGAPALRARVEALLRAYEEAGSFLDTPINPLTEAYRSVGDTSRHTPPAEAQTAVPSTAPIAGSAGPGTQIGPYRLGRVLGEGGMGAVYLAEQEEPIRRQVALKLIKPGMDSAHVVARFQAERQALTMMDHVGIARVFDAGTTTQGQPYFVMELVQGVPLTRFCDEHQLSIRQRLELFVAICQAVQHAHQKGIIHRDLKPSNVLAAMHDGKPVAKIIDFGLVKAAEQPIADQTRLTQAGVIVGTLQYMSPEQADYGVAGIDTRTDIYALGAMLYELLTGTTPLDVARSRGASLLELVIRIKQEEPAVPSARVAGLGDRLTAVAAARHAEPSRLVRQLRGELDWISAKALQKERDRRYESASAFARDVERYLADEPVEASPPSLRYQVGKYVRRHRILLVVIGVLLLGVGGLSWGLYAANSALAREAAQRFRAEKAVKNSYQAMRAAGASFQTMVRNRPAVTPAEKITLRNVITAYYAFHAEAADDEESRAAAAEALLTVGNIQVILEEDAAAEETYAAAIERFAALVDDNPKAAAYRHDLARSHHNLAFLLQRQAHPREAQAAYERAIDLYRKLADEFPAKAVYRRDMADAHNNLGALWRRAAQWPKARDAYGHAIALLEVLVRQSRDDLDSQVSLAVSNHNLGNILRDQGDAQAALACYGKAIARLEPIQPRPEDATGFLRNAYWDRAAALGTLHKHKDEVQDWQQALALEGQGKDRGAIELFLSAAQIDAQLQNVLKPAAQGLYQTAVVNAKAAAAANALGESLLHKRYLRRALALLAQVDTAGWFSDQQHLQRLKEDRAFDSLPREEFRAFVASLEAAKKG